MSLAALEKDAHTLQTESGIEPRDEETAVDAEPNAPLIPFPLYGLPMAASIDPLCDFNRWNNIFLSLHGSPVVDKRAAFAH